MSALIVLLAIVTTLVAAARLTDRPLEAQASQGPIEQERVVRISGTIDGSAHITDATGVTIADYAPGEAVFIATIARVIARERKKFGADLTKPIHLRKRSNNRISFFDPQTGKETELSSFGADNVLAFEVLFDM